MAKAASKASKESSKVRIKAITRPKRTKGREDDCPDLFGFLGNAILESEGPSNINRKNSAMKHVDFFLENIAEVKANTNDTLKYEDINETLAGKLASYFASHAHLNMSTEKDLIAPSTAVSYLSAWKNVIANKFRDSHPEIPIFRKDYWGKFLNSVAKIKYKYCLKKGIPMVTHKEMATEKEREGISKLCIWDGSGTFATFYAVVLTLFHIVGRTCEASGLLKTELFLGSEKSVSAEYPVLKVNVTRTKVQMESAGVHTYPHRSNMLFDLHFALAYSIIMNRSRNSSYDDIFPDFAARSNNESDEATEKTTAGLFNYYADKLTELAKIYGTKNVIMGERQYSGEDENMCFIP
ncbi:MAG: hypothetical protein ACJ04Q_13155, partial [Flavobacteriales bacterium]